MSFHFSVEDLAGHTKGRLILTVKRHPKTPAALLWTIIDDKAKMGGVGEWNFFPPGQGSPQTGYSLRLRFRQQLQNSYPGYPEFAVLFGGWNLPIGGSAPFEPWFSLNPSKGPQLCRMQVYLPAFLIVPGPQGLAALPPVIDFKLILTEIL